MRVFRVIPICPEEITAEEDCWPSGEFLQASPDLTGETFPISAVWQPTSKSH